ncbi:hypothetical protein HQQ81_13270 [Microbacteriaceae bacterium VKM Ac-2854]|nr:hypothetical protein [Microbacteriaceae bacterium VKM Ac-2854]
MTDLLPASRESWRGTLGGYSRPTATIELVAPISKSGGGSGAFLALADNGHDYWVKPLGNPQGDLVLATEQIVAAVGRLIDAPVRPVELVSIPASLAGWKYFDFHRLRPGIAHASLHLEATEEDEDLLYVRRDDNDNRYPAIMALWDLCMGGDEQWLHDQRSQFSVWSFDHGFWLGGEPDWTGDKLAPLCSTPWELGSSVKRFQPGRFHDLANALERLTPEDLLAAVARVPVEWKIPDWELETVAWVLHNRRLGVADRLRSAAART